MRYAAKILVATGVAACTFLSGVTAANAVPVTPVVSDWTVVAGSVGSVPDPVLGMAFDLAIDVQPAPALLATTSLIVTSAPAGPETAHGRAETLIDPVTFNQSVVKSGSKVSNSGAPPSNTDFRMLDFALGSLSATLSTAGLGLGDTATVDLLLNVTGSLIYTDPGGTAGIIEICDPFDPTFCELSPDMAASVSVLLALADVSDVIDPSLPLPFATLFNGSATLASVGGGASPALDLVGDFAASDLTPVGTCTAFFCQMDVDLTLTFTNVQSLGFGDTFDVGLLLLTTADAISDPGRSAEANFFDTATVDVTLTAVAAAAPAPGSLLLLAAGLMGIAAARRRASTFRRRPRSSEK